MIDQRSDNELHLSSNNYAYICKYACMYVCKYVRRSTARDKRGKQLSSVESNACQTNFNSKKKDVKYFPMITAVTVYICLCVCVIESHKSPPQHPFSHTEAADKFHSYTLTYADCWVT